MRKIVGVAVEDREVVMRRTFATVEQQPDDMICTWAYISNLNGPVLAVAMSKSRLIGKFGEGLPVKLYRE